MGEQEERLKDECPKIQKRCEVNAQISVLLKTN